EKCAQQAGRECRVLSSIAQSSPSPGTPGEGRGGGSANLKSQISNSKFNPHPNPPPEYRGRGRRRRDADGWGDQMERLAAWLREPPHPLGLWPCSAWGAARARKPCPSSDAAAPEGGGSAGVDDDDPLCELPAPPLSSVSPDTQRTGYVAAELLDKLMSGKK